MTFNTSQVSYYMTQRKKGITQHISAMKLVSQSVLVVGSKKESGQKTVFGTGAHAKILWKLCGTACLFLC